MGWDWSTILAPIATNFESYGSIVLVGFVSIVAGMIALKGAISVASHGIRKLQDSIR